MYFADFKNHIQQKLNPNLLWEYDISTIDYHEMRHVVVQRVIERGWPQDWYFLLNFYGIEQIKSIITELPYLNDKDMNFVSNQFSIPINSLKCYEKKQSALQHWSS
jgi:hypothetical protein